MFLLPLNFLFVSPVGCWGPATLTRRPCPIGWHEEWRKAARSVGWGREAAGAGVPPLRGDGPAALPLTPAPAGGRRGGSGAARAVAPLRGTEPAARRPLGGAGGMAALAAVDGREVDREGTGPRSREARSHAVGMKSGSRQLAPSFEWHGCGRRTLSCN